MLIKTSLWDYSFSCAPHIAPVQVTIVKQDFFKRGSKSSLRVISKTWRKSSGQLPQPNKITHCQERMGQVDCAWLHCLHNYCGVCKRTIEKRVMIVPQHSPYMTDRAVDEMVAYIVNLINNIILQPDGKIITWNTLCDLIFIFIFSVHNFL